MPSVDPSSTPIRQKTITEYMNADEVPSSQKGPERPSWQRVNKKRKLANSPETIQEAQRSGSAPKPIFTKANKGKPIHTQNRFQYLSEEAEKIDISPNETSSSKNITTPALTRTHKPPPIFVQQVSNFAAMVKS